MAHNHSNRRPSEVTPPHPKKRKTAIRLSVMQDPSGSGRQHEQPDRHRDNNHENATLRLPRTPFRGIGFKSASRPVRLSPLQEPPSHAAPAPRMLATPARPLARTVQEQVGRPRPSLGIQHLLPTKAAIKPRNQKQGPSMHAMTARGAMMTPSRNIPDEQERVLVSYPAIASGISDSEDSSDENFTISKPTILSNSIRTPPRGHSAARKTKVQIARKAVTSNSQVLSHSFRPSLIDSDRNDAEDTDDDLYIDVDPTEFLNRAQRLRDGDADRDAPSPSPSDELVPVTPEDLERELNEALKTLNIRESTLQARGRIPFLRRNLRKSLDILGERIHKSDDICSCGISKVTVTFVMGENEFTGGSFRGKWFCPVCIINMHFGSRQGLDVHLYRYHTQCDFEWSEAEDKSLLLTVTLPEIPESDTESDQTDEDTSSESDAEEYASDELQTTGGLNQSPPPEDKPFLRGSSVVKATAVFMSSPFKIQPVSPQLSPVRPGKEATRAKPIRPPRPIDIANPTRYPTPPPLTDLEGPSEVYPYIHEDSYSARPGGPRLYDILSELPLEPFGLMSWYIIDREEDIFELDNMRDEDKVMYALWGRWIFLNRTKFIANYMKGVQAFIDEYWRYIHRAAGFAALRNWLLVLTQNRFLTGSQFTDLLKYYGNIVGMEHWK